MNDTGPVCPSLAIDGGQTESFAVIGVAYKKLRSAHLLKQETLRLQREQVKRLLAKYADNTKKQIAV